jgi:signal transduction histidine kinase
MPQGGLIQVEASRSSFETSIVIRDSGCGIESGVVEHLFEPSVSTKPGGGLGLHIVKGIVQHNGGSVHAANRTDGPGAEFTIILPAHAVTRPAHA